MEEKIQNELLVIITNYACSLKCKDCANFIYKIPTDVKRQFIDPVQLKKDLKKLSCVLKTNRIQIQGGESTLHKELDSIIDIVTASGISQNIQLVTNATDVPNDSVLSSLKRNNTSVRISNYEIPIQKIPEWEEILKLHSIEYSLYQYAGGDDLWYDMGEYQMERNINDEEVSSIYQSCPYKICWTLSDGLLTKCSRSASSFIAGHHDYFESDFVNVRGSESDGMKIKLEKMLESGFMESCRYCNGVSGERVKPGEQIGRKKREIIKAAFYYSMTFQLRVLEPIAGEFEKFLISDNVEEIEDWKPDVIFTSDASQIPLLRNICDMSDIKLVGLRHGVANKYIPTDSEYSLADYVCGSKWDKDDFIQCNAMPLKNFFITGNPWIDSVFRIPKRELDEQNPTILFAPTYNPEVSAAVFLQDDLVKIIRKIYPESKIIIKPHPAILDYDHQYVNEFREIFLNLVNLWRKNVQDDKRVYLVEDSKTPISDFYSETDILVSDGSSLVFEFMALNRPILLYTSEQKIKMWDCIYDEKALANSRRNVGAEFKTKEEFEFVLKEAFNLHRNEHSLYQQKYSTEIFGEFTDGNSFKRVAECIKSAVKIEKKEAIVIRKPVNQYPIAKLYYDIGSGFSEENSKFRYITKKKDSIDVEINFDLKNIGNIHKLRFDPIENSTCIIEIKEVMLVKDDATISLGIASSNADIDFKNKLVFTNNDPNILFNIPQETGMINGVTIKLQYFTPEQYLPLIGEFISAKTGVQSNSGEPQTNYAKVYFNKGKGYSEDNSVTLPISNIFTNDFVELDFDLTNTGDIISLRFDPVEESSCAIDIFSIDFLSGGKKITPNVSFTNASFMESGFLAFNTLDPQIEFQLPDGVKKIDNIKIVYKMMLR